MRDIRGPEPDLAEFESAVALESEMKLQEKKLEDQGLRDISIPEVQRSELDSAVVLENEVKPQGGKKRRGKQEDTRKRLAEVMQAS